MELSLSKTKDSLPIANVSGHNMNIYIQPTKKKFDERCRCLSIDNSNEEDDTKLIPLPLIYENQRSALYISGVSGSGKSTSAAQYIKQIRKIHRYNDMPVYFFTWSALPDPAYKDIPKFYRVDLKNEDFMSLDTTECANSICLFDDYTSIPDKEIKTYIDKFIRELLENSRKQNTLLIIINHITQDYNRTRHIIFECDSYILYPQFNLNSTTKFLKSYLDLSDEQLAKIKDMDSRWIFVRKVVPRYLISEQEVILL